MADVLTKGTTMPTKLVSELIDRVKANSIIQRLSNQEPVPFNGSTQFVFSFDKDIDIVAENGEKGVGGVTLTPKTIVPIKFEYGARMSEEMWFAGEAEQMDLLRSFNEGFAKKLATGLDIAAIHGLNPRTKTASTVIGNNCIADPETVQYVEIAPTMNIDDAINGAVALVSGADYDTTGMALSLSASTDMGNLKTSDGGKIYPEFAFGGYPEALGGKTLAVSKNVAADGHTQALVGDFDMFKWGFARDIDLRVIQYGDPDGQGDLSRKNQIYLRAEAYIGWAVLDRNAFAIVTKND